MKTNKKINIEIFKITSGEDLDKAENKYRREGNSEERLPWASNAPYREIAEHVIPDKMGFWRNPIYLVKTIHKSVLGCRKLCASAEEYINNELIKEQGLPIDALSISSYMNADKIILITLVRSYTGKFDFTGFFDFVGDNIVEEIYAEDTVSSGNLLIPDEIKNFSYSKEDISKHKKDYKSQMENYKEATKELPFLNRIDSYIPRQLPKPEDSIDLVYDLLTQDMKMETVSSYDEFTKVFRDILTLVSGTEFYQYCNVMTGDKSEDSYMEFLRDYVERNYVQKNKFPKEDVTQLMKKVYRAIFQLYIVQDLIDDPDVTDIKITAPDSIRARVKGKAYMTNITFVDRNDYLRFVQGICLRCGVSQNIPEQTFTYTHDTKFILRLSLTAEYVNSVPWPYLHIRKVDRNKLLFKDLLEVGMIDEKLKNYLMDCGKNSRGVVFAGRPGSGKTVLLNAFLEEAYEQSAEILVIQENDELFCYRKGVMFQHVVNYAKKGESPVSLEELGKLALVAGANVFIIGEAKGAEICSAITLSNSGCRTAITIHSSSSTDTIDKMADLAMRGYATDYVQAKRMLKSFQTIVYLENFKVKEISEIVGFNEETQDMEYKYIYRRGAENPEE